jgi:hypothetical protein
MLLQALSSYSQVKNAVRRASQHAADAVVAAFGATDDALHDDGAPKELLSEHQQQDHDHDPNDHGGDTKRTVGLSFLDDPTLSDVREESLHRMTLKVTYCVPLALEADRDNSEDEYDASGHFEEATTQTTDLVEDERTDKKRFIDSFKVQHHLQPKS